MFAFETHRPNISITKIFNLYPANLDKTMSLALGIPLLVLCMASGAILITIDLGLRLFGRNSPSPSGMNYWLAILGGDSLYPQEEP